MSDSSPEPARGRSCLGFRRREAGQKRVPAPPARMTAWTCADIQPFVTRRGPPWHDGPGVPSPVFFDRRLAHGLCVGVRIPEEDAELGAFAEGALVPEEVAFASGLARLRRRTWIGGRVALREALSRSGISCACRTRRRSRRAPASGRGRRLGESQGERGGGDRGDRRERAHEGGRRRRSRCRARASPARRGLPGPRGRRGGGARCDDRRGAGAGGAAALFAERSRSTRPSTRSCAATSASARSASRPYPTGPWPCALASPKGRARSSSRRAGCASTGGS